MRSFQITDNRSFMAALFTGTLFGTLYVDEVSLITANTYHIDGHNNAAFYTSDELAEMEHGLPEYTSWDTLRALCFSLIKGKKAPVSFQITLLAEPALVEKLCHDPACTVPVQTVRTLALNIRYQEGTCRLISGTSLTTFLPDKSLDHLWDDYCNHFLTENCVSFEEE